MRTIGLIAVAITGLGLSGCSQISSVFKKKPHYHTDDGTTVYTGAEASLRTTPQQSYEFADQSYDVEIYDSASQYTGYSDSQYTDYSGTQYADYSTSEYTGYNVELYGAQPAYADPRDAEFVMLNGESKVADWQNCESRHRGYLFASEYDFRLNPGFEVCMRNKGYVMTTEYGPSSKQAVNAQTARLRGPVQFSQTSSSYSGYFR